MDPVTGPTSVACIKLNMECTYRTIRGQGGQVTLHSFQGSCYSFCFAVCLNRYKNAGNTIPDDKTRPFIFKPVPPVPLLQIDVGQLLRVSQELECSQHTFLLLHFKIEVLSPLAPSTVFPLRMVGVDVSVMHNDPGFEALAHIING